MKKQSGSAHVIIIVIVALVLLGALGFVFWKNIQKNADKTDTQEDSQVSDAGQTPQQTETKPELVTKDLMTVGNFGITYKMPKTWAGGQYGGGDTISDEESTTLTAPDGFTIKMTISPLTRGWSPDSPMATILDAQKSTETTLAWVVVDHTDGVSGPIGLQIADGQNVPAVGDKKVAGSSIYKLGEAEGSGVYLEVYGGYSSDMSLESFNAKESVKQAKAIFESIKAGV